MLQLGNELYREERVGADDRLMANAIKYVLLHGRFCPDQVEAPQHVLCQHRVV